MSTTADIDAILDLAAPATSTDNNTDNANTDENGTGSDAETSSESEGGALYPNVLRTLTASQAGEGNPEGTLSIAEFAAHLTVEAIKAGAGVEGVVDKANIYTATKAKRRPLPVVLVFADDADQSDLSKAKVYLPVTEATEVYQERLKNRGDGAASASSKKTPEDLLTDAAKRSISLANVTKRYNRVAEQKAKAAKLLDKSYGWLKPYYKATEADLQTKEDGSQETQEEADRRLLTAAIAAKAAEIEEAEAAKAESEKSDITDSE